MVFTDGYLNVMSLKVHSVLREWHMASSLSELDTDFLAYIFQNQNMELTTSQRYRWNELSGKALTTQELRLSLFPWLCFLSCMCLGIETSWGKRDCQTPAGELTALSRVRFSDTSVMRLLATLSRDPNLKLGN